MPEHIHDITGATNLYAVIANTAGQRWNGSSFETMVVANWGTYDIPLSESPASSYRYPITVPAGISSASVLIISVYEQSGGSPLVSDTLLDSTEVHWNGTSVVSAPGPTLAEMVARTIESGDYFDPAADTVANVTLVATTTTNTDMRGTDGANTAVPDNASITAIKAKTDNLPASPAAVGSEMALEDDAITASKIATGALTAAKFASGAFDAVWAVAARTITAFGFEVTTDSASRTASQADVSGLLTRTEATADKNQIIEAFDESLSDNAFLVPHTIRDTNNATIAACQVVVTSTNTSDSNDVVASGYTNDGGKIEFMLLAGTYYLWRNKRLYNFTDPVEFTVGSDGTVTYA